MVKSSFSLVKQKIKQMIINLFYYAGVNKNRIVITNFNGKGYGDNPKYIVEEINRKKLPYEIIWLVNHFSDEYPSNVRQVKFGSISSIYYLSTCRILINTVKNALPFKKKPNKQYYLQVMHGPFGPKLVEGDAIDKLSARYIKESKEDSVMTDAVVSSSRMQSDLFRTAYWYSCEILETGTPRNDILFKATEKDKKQIREKVGLKKGQRVVIYAPTFRDDGNLDVYKLDAEIFLDALNKKTGDDWVMLVSAHPNLRNKMVNLFSFNNRVLDVTKYPDIQELVLVADAVVTDYSSIMTDFSILKKVVILFATDIEEYTKLRGLKPFYYTLPFPLCKSNHELIASIEKFDINTYRTGLRTFLQEYGSFDDGHASERVVRKIMQIIEGEETQKR